MFIRAQKVIRGSDGNILSGSASLYSTEYLPNPGNSRKNHSKQKVIEKLGKILWMDEHDNKRGIFLSPTRGIVYYDVELDQFSPVPPDDQRLQSTKFEYQPQRSHVSFGPIYLFFSILEEKTPYMNILRDAFPDGAFYQRVIAHIAHGCLRNHRHIKCGDYVDESILSYITTEIATSTLNCDSAYYAMLSDDKHKMGFFSSLIHHMRSIHPNFGRACYVDSTPLPGEAEGNPFNALSSHGADGVIVQSRLVLVLDIETHILVWFEIIPANVLDKSTILNIRNDLVSTLGIVIDEATLDAGYARKELFDEFNIDNNKYIDPIQNTERDHTVLVRMPAVEGYKHDELYLQCKPHFYDTDYQFDYENHTYYGERREINLFDNKEYAFVYVDKDQAGILGRKWRTEHPSEWKEMCKDDRDWYNVRHGYFCLVGNRDQSPRDAVIEYRSKQAVEGFFKDAKSYLDILPIAKWTKETVIGKILNDVMETAIYREFRKQLANVPLSVSDLLVELESWMCTRMSDSLIETKTAKTQVREHLEMLGYTDIGHLDLNAFRAQILSGKCMERTPVTQKRKSPGRKSKISSSPEEKARIREQEQELQRKKKEERAAEEAKRKEEARKIKDAEDAQRMKVLARKKAMEELEKEKAREKKRIEKQKRNDEKKAAAKMESVRKRREFRNNVEIEKEELRKNEAGSSSEDTPAYSQNEAD